MVCNIPLVEVLLNKAAAVVEGHVLLKVAQVD